MMARAGESDARGTSGSKTDADSYVVRSIAASAAPGWLRSRRQWLARKQVGPGRGVVDERRDDGRHLPEVGRLDAIVDVHVRVVRPRVVLDRILDELKAGQSHGIEEVWSVPPVLRMVIVPAPRSANGLNHSSKIGRMRSFPCR